MAGRHFVVLGADGMLGGAFMELLQARGLRASARTEPTLDLTDRANVEASVPDDADVVINCAAWTDVDGAEQNEAAATTINGTALGWLSARCARVDAVLVGFGTDYVFDGRGQRPYTLDHPLSPLNAYGRSKAAGETALASGPGEYLFVRTSWLYAPWGNNFVRTMARLGKERDVIRVVNDQHGRPTSATYLARQALALLDHGVRGVAHATDGGSCTWFEFAAAVMQGLKLPCTVQPCSTTEMPRPAARPGYSVLDLSETERLLGPSRHWSDNLADVLGRLQPPATFQ